MSDEPTVTETAKVGDELVQAIGQKLDLAYSRHRQNNYLGSYSDYRRDVLALITAARRDALERAAKVAEERARGRAQLFEENGASINAAKSVEAEEIASAIRALIDQDTAGEVAPGSRSLREAVVLSQDGAAASAVSGTEG